MRVTFEEDIAVVGKKKRKARSGQLMGSHQKCWLWGRHAVLETLRAGRWLPLEVAFSDELLDPKVLDEVEMLVETHRLDANVVSREELQRCCGTSDHQGIAAKMPPYPYATAESLLQQVHAKSAVLVLAGIQDPFNFGSILRSADLFGFDAVVVPTSGQAAVSSHVVRSSVGAVNYLDVVQVDDLAQFCLKLKAQGVGLYAASEHGSLSPDAADFLTRTAIIIGNEGSGVPANLLALCDHQVCIPLQGHVGSLNAAVAAGILCYELQRQRIAAG